MLYRHCQNDHLDMEINMRNANIMDKKINDVI